MRFRSLGLLSLTFLALSCASAHNAGRPSAIPQPEMNAELVNDPFFGSTLSAPVTLDVKVRNKGNVPITVRRIELDSPTMTEWGFPRQARDYREVIEPGIEKSITFFATARAITTQRNEPLSYRLQITFEAGESQWREILNIISNRPPPR
jgi:hypothetical protein